MAPTAPIFSVIVPVYNVEEYVAECLDSVLAQTFRNFELITIDDGCTDGSSDILTQYAARDARIRVIRQENGGLSVARNAGVAAATGHYCLFVDSDDVIHHQLLEICHHFLDKHKADFVAFNYASIAPHAGLPQSHLNLKSLRYHLSNQPHRLLFQRHRHRIPLMTQNSCYRTELARMHPFIEGILYEDYPHTVCLMRDITTAISIQQELYGYTTRPGSIMNSRFSANNIAHYRLGLLSIAEAYAEDEQLRATVLRIIYPEILKQIANLIFRIHKRDEEWMGMLRAFRALLVELDKLDLLNWRGHKLRRYMAFRKLIRTRESGLQALIPKLSKVFY